MTQLNRREFVAAMATCAACLCGLGSTGELFADTAAGVLERRAKIQLLRRRNYRHLDESAHALFAFQVLPINYVGLVLIHSLALPLFLPASSVTAQLRDTWHWRYRFLCDGFCDVDQYRCLRIWSSVVSLSLCRCPLPVHCSSLVVVGMALKARNRPVVSGREELMGTSV